MASVRRAVAADRSDPDQHRAGRRPEIVDWLLRWGDDVEAHKQALIGSRLANENEVLRSALTRTVETLAGR